MPAAPLEQLPGLATTHCVVLVGPAPRGSDPRLELAAALERTPRDVALVACLPPDVGAWWTGLAAAEGRPVAVLDGDPGLARALASVMAAAPRADVAVLDSRTEVAEGWLDGLRAALSDDPTVGSATALATHAGLLSVPARNLPWPLLPPALTLEEAARRVRDAAADDDRGPARVPVPLGHAVLLARTMLDLVGPPDEAAGPGAACIVGLGARAAACGLRHVVAGSVLVLHRGDAEAPDPAAPWIAPEAVGPVAALPGLADELRDAAFDRFGPLSRTLLRARRALTGGDVTLDARGLTPGRSGTKLALVELAAALAAADATRLRIVLPDRPDPELGAIVEGLGVEVLRAADAAGAGRTDVLHRPYGIDRASELADADQLGERLVLTQHDLIGFHDPAVFATAEEHLAHRRATALGLGAAGAVLVPSAHVRADLVDADLVAPERVLVAPNGALPVVSPAAGTPARAPAGLEALGDRPFLAMVGADLRHKGVPFALELLHELTTTHGWDGGLVLAGTEPLAGSSRAQEAARLAADPALAARVVRLAAIDDAERRWLQEHAAAVCYPSTVEGFGFVPFEAAAAGTPCLWAPVASLADSLPADLAPLVPWDPAASARRALPLLRDPAAADTAATALAAYDLAARLPAAPGAASADRHARTEAELWTLRAALGADAVRLVGPDDPLLAPLDQARAVAAMRTPAGRRAVRAALRAAARARRDG